MLSQHTLSTFLIILFGIFLLMSLMILHQETTWVFDWEIASINSCTISLPIILDASSAFMASTVTFISFNIFIFSKTYMMDDPNKTRFLYILLLFIMSMIALVFCPNIISLMLGWDGLGITSFLLVIYYPTSDALDSGMVTALTNRIGDCFLLLSMALMASQGQWSSWSMWAENMNNLVIVGLFIFMASMTKSAQMPFMVWLPEAMAAPTPVSALVHSSTLVTAGVYLIMRFYPFLMSFENLNMVLCISSSFTVTASSMWATVEYDIKKIIALSTLSHISMMMLMLSIGLPFLAFLHLLSHAMFKSLLFLVAGVQIMFAKHQQNLQNLESFRRAPSVSTPATISLASLNAFFFTSGYYSKELIADTVLSACQSDDLNGLILNGIGAAVGAGITYSIRLHRVLSNSTKLVFPDGFIAYTLSTTWYANDFNNSLRTPIFMLSLGALMMSSVSLWAFMTPYHTPFNNTFYHVTPWVWTTTGFLTATSMCALNHKYKSTYIKSKKWEKSKSQMWFEYWMDSTNNESALREHANCMLGLEFLTYKFNPYIMKLSNMIYKFLDQGWLSMYQSSTAKAISSNPSKKIIKFDKMKVLLWVFISVMSMMMMALLIMM